MNYLDRIQIDASVCGGKPVIRETRVPVAIVAGSLAAGMSFDGVAREYDLSDEDIRAALATPARVLARNRCIHCLHVPREVPARRQHAAVGRRQEFASWARSQSKSHGLRPSDPPAR